MIFIKKDKVKTINGLMKHLRIKHNIDINGGGQKRKLRNIGYYHGYKGYRFIKESANHIEYKKFSEIVAMNEFDNNLKGIFYVHVMFLENALKNYALEVVLQLSKTDSFEEIYNKLLIDYKKYKVGSGKYKESIKSRLDLRTNIYSALKKKHTKSVVMHFYQKDQYVPIWAIFEILTLGEFGFFIKNLDTNVKMNISDSIGLNKSYNSDGKILENLIFVIRDLRNAIAHNAVIFDTRFKENEIKSAFLRCIEYETGINNINFRSIVDYVVLVCYMLKKFSIEKNRIYKIINEFKNISDDLRKSIDFAVYSRIILTDSSKKLEALKKYIKE